MKIEQLLQSKSKEEIAFILYQGNNGYKICCINCDFYKADKHNVHKCNSLFEIKCREEYYNWLKSNIENKND